MNVSRHMVRALVLPLLGLMLTALTVSTTGASIRVVEDEVYFTLKAPGAKQVYLVGDFNNWNATVEKMERSGDVFEISLYLVEGTYRYKFVVDGNWITDPDNPGDDPARGSLIVLVEKPAGLMLRTEDPATPAAFCTAPGGKVMFEGEGSFGSKVSTLSQASAAAPASSRTRQ